MLGKSEEKREHSIAIYIDFSWVFHAKLTKTLNKNGDGQQNRQKTLLEAPLGPPFPPEIDF